MEFKIFARPLFRITFEISTKNFVGNFYLSGKQKLSFWRFKVKIQFNKNFEQTLTIVYFVFHKIYEMTSDKNHPISSHDNAVANEVSGFI